MAKEPAAADLIKVRRDDCLVMFYPESPFWLRKQRDSTPGSLVRDTVKRFSSGALSAVCHPHQHSPKLAGGESCRALRRPWVPLSVLVYQRVRGLTLPADAPRLFLKRGVCTPAKCPPPCTRKATFLRISRRQFRRTPSHLSRSKPLTSNH